MRSSLLFGVLGRGPTDTKNRGDVGKHLETPVSIGFLHPHVGWGSLRHGWGRQAALSAG